MMKSGGELYSAVFEGVIPEKAGETDRMELTVEDGGQAMIAEFEGAEGSSLFVRLHSWDEARRHSEIRRLQGRRVRVTIEELPTD